MHPLRQDKLERIFCLTELLLYHVNARVALQALCPELTVCIMDKHFW